MKKSISIKEFAALKETTVYIIHSAIVGGKLNTEFRFADNIHRKFDHVILDENAEKFQPIDRTKRKYITISRNMKEIKRGKKKILKPINDSLVYLNTLHAVESFRDFIGGNTMYYLDENYNVIDG